MSTNEKDSRAFDGSRRTLLQYGFFALALGLTCGMAGARNAHAAGTALEGKKVLVAYFSRTGNTRLVDNRIHEVVAGDIFEIQTVAPYPEDYRKTTEQAKKELESGFRPPLKSTVANMPAYDIVFVGSPCWWGTIATPVITFLTSYDFSGKTLVPFMTHEGSGLGRTMAHVRELCPDSRVLQGLAVRGGAAGKAAPPVRDWLHAMGMA